MSELTRTLNNIEGVDDWQLDTTTTRTTTMLFLRPDPRDIIANDGKVVRLTVYNKHETEPNEVRMGISSGEVALATQETLGRLARELVANARGQNNPVFSLVEPGLNYPDVPLLDLEIADADPQMLQSMARDFYGRLQENAQGHTGVSLSNVELFLTTRGIRTLNSRGLDLSQQGTRVYLELTVLASDGTRREEFTERVNTRRLNDIDPSAVVKRCATYARDSLEKRDTPTYEGDVILTGSAAKDYLAPSEVEGFGLRHSLYSNALGRTRYLNQTRLKLGSNVCEGEIKGDKLTIVSNPLLPFRVNSTRFGGDGLPAEKFTLLDDGRLAAWITDQQYAQYLGIQPTGPLGNITIPRGSLGYNELLYGDGKPKLVICEFSWFDPDSVSGDFSTEIRHGYFFDGTHLYPVRGGLLTGNWFDSLRNIQLSRETISFGNYRGPRAIRLNEMSVSGK